MYLVGFQNTLMQMTVTANCSSQLESTRTVHFGELNYVSEFHGHSRNSYHTNCMAVTDTEYPLRKRHGHRAQIRLTGHHWAPIGCQIEQQYPKNILSASSSASLRPLPRQLTTRCTRLAQRRDTCQNPAGFCCCRS